MRSPFDTIIAPHTWVEHSLLLLAVCVLVVGYSSVIVDGGFTVDNYILLLQGGTLLLLWLTSHNARITNRQFEAISTELEQMKSQRVTEK